MIKSDIIEILTFEYNGKNLKECKEKISTLHPNYSEEFINQEVEKCLEIMKGVHVIDCKFLLKVNTTSGTFFSFKYMFEDGSYTVFDIEEGEIIPSFVKVQGDNFTLSVDNGRLRNVISVDRTSESEFDSIMEKAIHSFVIVPFKVFLSMLDIK